MEPLNTITTRIRESIAMKERMLGDALLLKTTEEAALHLYRVLSEGHRVFFCGNGGSAADAQHLAAELSGRFSFDRAPLPAEACHTNTSFLTAVSNDYSYEQGFARYIEGFGRSGDLLVALSTSGNSSNVLKAMAVARRKGMTIIGLTGENGGKMKEGCDYLLNVPSRETPRIQEGHITLGHILCEIAEKMVFA